MSENTLKGTRTLGGSVTVALPKLDIPGYTYFIRVGSEIKIGSSARPERRFKQLRDYYPNLTVVSVVSDKVADEYKTHKRFAHLRVRGEWFRAEPELLDFIADLGTPVEIPSTSMGPSISGLISLIRRAKNPIKRAQIGTLIKQLETRQTASGGHLELLDRYIAHQLRLLAA